MDGRVCVNVPHGFWDGGNYCRDLWLRPINSNDEALVAESAGASVAHRANELLTRCLADGDASLDRRRSRVRDLAAGDREALLLHLRRISFGERFDGIFHCRRPECDAALELDLHINDLLLAPYGHASQRYQRVLRDGDSEYHVNFRLPTAGDQEEVVGVARSESERAARMIFERCVTSVEADGCPVALEGLPSPLFEQAVALMEELDPQAVIEFELQCPECGNCCSAILDTASFLLQEVDQHADHLLREIHTLAVWYHWSEEAILNMPKLRRERYLDLIAAETGRA
jgi:hypothetical protein